MTGDTIRDVKKRLAAAFPSVVFTYGKAGRGRQGVTRSNGRAVRRRRQCKPLPRTGPLGSGTVAAANGCTRAGA